MEGLTSAVYNAIEGALNLLPKSPFAFLQNYSSSPIGQWLGWLNWFIPVSSFVSILSAWCSAILVYYVIQIILRWGKAIQ